MYCTLSFNDIGLYLLPASDSSLLTHFVFMACLWGQCNNPQDEERVLSGKITLVIQGHNSNNNIHMETASYYHSKYYLPRYR